MPDEHHEIRITPAKDAAEARRYIEQMVSPMNVAHALLLRAGVAAQDRGDQQLREMYVKAAAEFRDAMAFLAAIEAYLYNQTLPRKE